jgi:hypothetical protein
MTTARIIFIYIDAQLEGILVVLGSELYIQYNTSILIKKNAHLSVDSEMTTEEQI